MIVRFHYPLWLMKVMKKPNKKTVKNSTKVRFKGYGTEDLMWLPLSFFNRPITFESTSKFGRKRKHTLDPDIAVDKKCKE